MRVLHVLNSLRGGAAMSALQLMRTSAAIGSPVEHYVVYPGTFGRRRDDLSGCARDWACLPLRTWHRTGAPAGLRGALRHLRQERLSALLHSTYSCMERLVSRWDIDVIHTNTSVILDAARFAAYAGIPHVWHIRERIGSAGFVNFPVPDETVARAVWDLSSSIPVISRYVQEFFEFHGVGRKTVLVHDGVDPSIFGSRAAMDRGHELRKAWGIPEGAVVVGMVGGLATPAKRHDIFLRCASAIARVFPDVWFVVVGAVPLRRGRWLSDPAAYSTKVLRLAEDLGLGRRLVFAGYEEDAPAVWNAMNVYVHPCKVEAFSRSILEAPLAGVPVVAAAAGGNVEAIDDGRTGTLVPPDEPEAFSEAVGRLLNDPQLAASQASEAAREVSEKFSVERYCRRMEAVLTQAVVAPSSAVGRSGPVPAERA